MANQSQVAYLQQGSDIWNRWRNSHQDAEIDLSYADCSDADLSYADLTGVDLSYAVLSHADLSAANLSDAKLRAADLRCADLRSVDLRSADLVNADLSEASLSYGDLRSADLRSADLSNADLSYADLSHADLSDASLSHADLSEASLRSADLRSGDLINAILRAADLSNTDLSYADLSYADLSDASLINANLRAANLSDANLKAAQLLKTTWQQTILTGACIQEWQIGSSTLLADVRCDYIFRTDKVEQRQFTDRLPVNPERIFAPGEFAQRFQIVASTLPTRDLVFAEGIDWQAWWQAFHEVQRHWSTTDISIQGIEHKNEALVVKLAVESDRDQATIESQIQQRYRAQLKMLAARYAEQLQVPSSQSSALQELLQHQRQQQLSLTPAISCLAHRQQHFYETTGAIQAALKAAADTHRPTTDAGRQELQQMFHQAIAQHPQWRAVLQAGGLPLAKVLCIPLAIPLEIVTAYLHP